jgi:hypothetical protein
VSHVDDATLALLADGAALDAPLQAHVDGCDVCRARLAVLRDLQRDLADARPLPSVVADVEARLQRPPWWSLAGWRLPALASAAAAFALVVVVAGRDPGRGGDDGPTGFTPRGGGSGPGLLLIADGRVVDDDGITTTAALRADLVHPDPRARHLVVGVDDGGHVHWLRPAFVDAARPPACPAPVSGERVVGEETVALPLSPGALDVRLYAVAVDAPCDVVALDAALTAKAPTAKAPTVAWRLVQQQRVVVTP